MNQEQQQFLALLRAGVWDTTTDSQLFSGIIHWDAIFEQAARQTVQGLVAKAASTLPTRLQPPAPILNKARGILAATIRSHALLNRTLADAVMMLQQNGICPVLLKGQGVATNYADPTLRICGDIDLYIGQRDYYKACRLARKWAEGAKAGMESDKHYHFCHEGVTVEFHRYAERLPLPWHNARFQVWSYRHLHGDRLRPLEIEGLDVWLPPVNFDALYIFNHAWHHFLAGGGIGWRQLCDWVRYLHTFRNEIDRAELGKDLHSFGLWQPWRVFGSIAVDMLGLPCEEYPFYTDRYARQAAIVAGMIEEGGNFGFFDSDRSRRPEGYIAGKLHSLGRMNRRSMKLFSLFPVKVATAWSYYLYIGISQVIKDMLRQTPLENKQ